MFVQIHTMDLGYNWESWGKKGQGMEESISIHTNGSHKDQRQQPLLTGAQRYTSGNYHCWLISFNSELQFHKGFLCGCRSKSKV